VPTKTSQAGIQVANTTIPVLFGNSIGGGWIGYTTKTSDQTGISTETTVMTVGPVTVGSNRILRISAFVDGGGTVAGDRIAVRIKEGATQLTAAVDVNPIADGAITTMTFTPWMIIAATAGSHTYTCTAERIGGTGTFAVQASATQPGLLVVEDIGSV
jgi:hypothetical protein